MTVAIVPVWAHAPRIGQGVLERFDLRSRRRKTGRPVGVGSASWKPERSNMRGTPV